MATENDKQNITEDAESLIQKAKDLAANAGNSISDTFGNLGLSAKSLLDNDISDVVKSLPSTAGNFISKTFKQNETLTDLTSKISETANKANEHSAIFLLTS